MRRILAIDPGPIESGYFDGRPLNKRKPFVTCAKLDNITILNAIKGWKRYPEEIRPRVVIEEFVSYGRRIGASSIQTIRWIGRFEQVCCDYLQTKPVLVPRRHIAQWLCDSHKAKDADIRQRLIDIFGGGRDVAIGRKAQPGPLYGVKKDAWLALALAYVYAESGGRPIGGHGLFTGSIPSTVPEDDGWLRPGK